MNMKKIIATNLIIASTLGAVLMTPNLAKAEFEYKDALYIQPESDAYKNNDIDTVLRGEWRYEKLRISSRCLTDEEIEYYMQQVYDNPAEADRREAEYLKFHNGNLDRRMYRYDLATGYIVNNMTEEKLIDEEAKQAAAQATPVPAQEEEDDSSNYEVPINDVTDSQTSTDNLDASLVTDNFEKEDATLETESVETETGEEIESTEEVSEENTEESSEDTAPKKEEKKKSKNPIVRVTQGIGDVFVTLGNSIVHFFGGIGKAISNIF